MAGAGRRDSCERHCGELTVKWSCGSSAMFCSIGLISRGARRDQRSGVECPPCRHHEEPGQHVELARASEIAPVPVTVPSLRDIAGGERRRGHGSSNIGAAAGVERVDTRLCAASKGLTCVDLFTATADPVTHQLAAPYSNDGLHLTTAGYRLLARLLYDQVFAKSDGQTGRMPRSRTSRTGISIRLSGPRRCQCWWNSGSRAVADAGP